MYFDKNPSCSYFCSSASFAKNLVKPGEEWSSSLWISEVPENLGNYCINSKYFATASWGFIQFTCSELDANCTAQKLHCALPGLQ